MSRRFFLMIDLSLVQLLHWPDQPQEELLMKAVCVPELALPITYFFVLGLLIIHQLM